MKQISVSTDEIVALYEEIGSYKIVAEKLGIGATTARRHLVKAGIKAPLRSVGRASGLSAERQAAYYHWRKDVLARDGYRCLKCGAGGTLVAHHIVPWKAEEGLRFDVSNGITLCPACHFETYKRELDFVDFFMGLLNNSPVCEPPHDQPEPETYVCLKCGRDLPRDRFGKHCESKWGWFKTCKDCRNAAMHEYIQENNDVVRASTRRWFQNNKERRNDYTSRWWFDHLIQLGKIPRWTERRAALGLVPASKKDWPTQEILDRVKQVA